MRCTTWPTPLLLWAAVIPAVGGREGQLLWEPHLSPPDSTELPSQARTFAVSPPDLTSSHPRMCS